MTFVISLIMIFSSHNPALKKDFVNRLFNLGRIQLLTILHDSDGTSQLYGEVCDQAALYGLIIRLRDLGLDLISVALVPPPEDTNLDPGI